MFWTKTKVVVREAEKGELRWTKDIFKKGDKVVREETTLQFFNGHYWEEVPTKVHTRTWTEEDDKGYFKFD